MSESSSKSPAKRKYTTKIQTCDICKIRHQKCDGQRPSCYHCKIRNLDCRYTDLPSTKSSKIRRTTIANERSATSNTPSLESPRRYVAAQAIVTEELSELEISRDAKDKVSERLLYRLADSIIEPPRIAPAHAMSRPARKAQAEYLADTLRERVAQTLGISPPEIQHKVSDDRQNQSQLPILLPGQSFDASQDLVQHTPYDVARAWLDHFLEGLNRLLGLVDESESQKLLHSMYAQDALSPAQSASLTFQVAVGARMADDVSGPLHIALYEKARQQLDLAIEQGIGVAVIQPLLLGCLYLMDSKLHTCRLLIGLAIHISQSNRIDVEHHHCPFMSFQEHARWHKVWQSIYFLDCWTSVRLGLLPQICVETTHDPFVHNVTSNIKIPSQDITHNVALIAALIGRILREVYASEQAVADSTDELMQAFETWAKILPDNLQFDTHNVNESMTRRKAVSTLLLELLYLTGIMLLSIPALEQTFIGEKPGPSQRASMQYWSQLCIDTATHIGQVSNNIVEQGIYCRKSFLTSDINYQAALVLIYGLCGQEYRSNYGQQAASEKARRSSMASALNNAKRTIELSATQSKQAALMLSNLNCLESAIVSHPGPDPAEAIESANRYAAPETFTHLHSRYQSQSASRTPSDSARAFHSSHQSSHSSSDTSLSPFDIHSPWPSNPAFTPANTTFNPMLVNMNSSLSNLTTLPNPDFAVFPTEQAGGQFEPGTPFQQEPRFIVPQVTQMQNPNYFFDQEYRVDDGSSRQQGPDPQKPSGQGGQGGQQQGQDS